MKKGTNSNWQKQLLLAAIATMVFMFAANSLASAQANYKVGDKIEVLWMGTWFKGAVLEAKGDSFKVHYDGYGNASDEWVTPAKIRRIGGTSPANNQTAPNAAKTYQTGNQPSDRPTQTTKPNKYGARDPRPCADTKTSGRGAITMALAKLAFLCNTEKVSGNYLYLVENVKLEVGGGRAFQPVSDVNYSEIDVRVPIYPIRGSYTKYQCDAESAILENVGKNCIRYEHRKATGSCYKTTFGDWRCSMYDLGMANDDWHRDVPPPK